MRKSLTQQVVDKLSNDIAEGILKPGDKVANEFELAKDMNVSRSTIREAVKQLVSSGVFEIHRGDGTYVCQNIGVKDPLGFKFSSDKKKLALDLCELRLVLEPWIVRQAAVKATKEEIDEMEELQAKVEECIEKDINHSEPDIELHVCWARCTGNSVIPKIVPILMDSIPLFIDLTKRRLIEPTKETHRAIIKAIKNRDPDAAEAAMKQHLQFNFESIQQTEI